MLLSMDTRLTIGEFSKMTYLSVKALRHYHDVGLLAPVAVDPTSGYRYYEPDQVTIAQAIRRFRNLDMPIDEVRAVLDAPDAAARNQAILVHLERLHERLDQTLAGVASLHALLTGEPSAKGPVEIRRLATTRVLQTSAAVAFDDCAAWLEPALAGLRAQAADAGVGIAGAEGALYSDAFFEEGVGEVIAFVPVDGGNEDEGVVGLDSATFAVLTYDGPFADLDQAYGALGTFVAEQGIGGRGPIREHYLTDTVTEVCWPVTTGASA